MTTRLPRSMTLVLALVATAFIVGCGTTGITVPTGDAQAGASTFTSKCVSCHSASNLAGSRSLVTNNLGSLNGAMSGITLTDTEVSNLMAYLATQ